MAVKIRLSRIGTTNSPMFRVVAIDSRSKRDGKALDILGTYNPRSGEFVKFEFDKIEEWISKGAIPTESVKKLKKRYKKSQESKIS